MSELWPWLVIGYLAFVCGLVGYAAHVALSRTDSGHRQDGYRVLKLLWGGTGAGGLLLAISAVVVRLGESAP